MKVQVLSRAHMRIVKKEKYILIISPNFIWLFGLLNGVAKNAKGGAMYPFIFLAKDEYYEDWIINHELIHFAQQKELLFIGMWLLNIVEWLYFVLIKRYNLHDAYIMRASEQEAYRNQNNQAYLPQRKKFQILKYLKDKKYFKHGKPGEIIFTSKDRPK